MGGDAKLALAARERAHRVRRQAEHPAEMTAFGGVRSFASRNAASARRWRARDTRGNQRQCAAPPVPSGIRLASNVSHRVLLQLPLAQARGAARCRRHELWLLCANTGLRRCRSPSGLCRDVPELLLRRAHRLPRRRSLVHARQRSLGLLPPRTAGALPVPLGSRCSASSPRCASGARGAAGVPVLGAAGGAQYASASLPRRRPTAPGTVNLRHNVNGRLRRIWRCRDA